MIWSPRTRASLHERGAKRPEGVIVGKGAEQFATLLVDEPYEEPMEPIDTEQHLPWPSRLSEEMHRTLPEGRGTGGAAHVAKQSDRHAGRNRGRRRQIAAGAGAPAHRQQGDADP